MRDAIERDEKDSRTWALVAISENSLTRHLRKHGAALHENRARQSKCRTRAGFEIRLNPKALPLTRAGKKANSTTGQCEISEAGFVLKYRERICENFAAYRDSLEEIDFLEVREETKDIYSFLKYVHGDRGGSPWD
jgi:hypothetical protein